ncbi:MAG: J domain-containing protein [Beijerinckiaceae bacterium]|jgi:DnaJ-class molecular chaperone|nr:J domain-containing protein [Beijerinckiaceae bacterium]
MRDPYAVLGVNRDAGAEEIKRAFRRLAKAHHPDHNKNDPRAKERFAEINSAYEILGDAGKKRAFDRGEIDAEGRPRAGAGMGFDPAAGAGGPGAFRFDFGAGSGRADPRDMFSDIFRQFETPGRGESRSGRASPIPAGEDIELEAAITLEDVLSGGSRRITLPDGRTVEVNIPKGAANGATLRLRGQGLSSPFGGPNGDVRVTLRYQRHPRFVVDGQDLRIAVAVPIREAVLGGAIRVPTLQGEVEVTVPAWTSGGKTLRLRGKGLPGKDAAGDLFVSLDIDLGPPDPEMEGFFRRRRA